MIGRAAEAAVEQAIAAIEAAVPPDGVSVERTDSGVRLSGPGLLRRWMIDPDLRGFAGEAARSMR